MCQEAQCKHLERSFGALQDRWRIIVLSFFLVIGSFEKCNHCMHHLHHMITEDESEFENTRNYLFDNIQDEFLVDNVNHENARKFLDFKNIRMKIMREVEHFQLVEHLWIQNEDKQHIEI